MAQVVGRGDDGSATTVRYTFLYTHWNGSQIRENLRVALSRKLRWNDPAYLTRIIFDTMTAGDQGSETGYGISAGLCDNQHPVLIVDCGRQVVYIVGEDEARKAATERRRVLTCTGDIPPETSFKDWAAGIYPKEYSEQGEE